MSLGSVGADESALFGKEMGASWSGRSPESPRSAFGSCDVLTPTPSAYPWGYSTWAGGASVGEVWLEMGWTDDVDLLEGAVGAIG